MYNKFNLKIFAKKKKRNSSNSVQITLNPLILSIYQSINYRRKKSLYMIYMIYFNLPPVKLH